MNLTIPPALKDVEHKCNDDITEMCDLGRIDITQLSPSERNRLLIQYSSLDGGVTPNLTTRADNWSKSIVSEDKDRYKPNGSFEIKPNSVPRSRLIDTFFSHQLPGLKDSILTDVRKLVKLQDEIETTARNTTKQYKLAMFRLQQSNPDKKILERLSTISDNPLDSIQKMLEEEELLKVPHVNPRLMQTTVSAILENTDGITADYTNGQFSINEKK